MDPESTYKTELTFVGTFCSHPGAAFGHYGTLLYTHYCRLVDFSLRGEAFCYTVHRLTFLCSEILVSSNNTVYTWSHVWFNSVLASLWSIDNVVSCPKSIPFVMYLCQTLMRSHILIILGSHSLILRKLIEEFKSMFHCMLSIFRTPSSTSRMCLSAG